MVHASQHLCTAMCIMVKDMNKIELSLICFRCWSEIQDNQHSLAWIDKECFEILGLWNYKTDLLDFIVPVLYHLYIVCFSHSSLLFFFLKTTLYLLTFPLSCSLLARIHSTKFNRSLHDIVCILLGRESSWTFLEKRLTASDRWLSGKACLTWCTKSANVL